jgi:uncharacterized protein (DUF1501 family)
MLRITDTRRAHTCQGFTRRDLLRIGGLGLAGFGLADLLRLRAQGAQAAAALRDKSIVLLFLQGGPSHIETFDPKMTAPLEMRAIFGEVPTRLPGVTFGAHFPQMAARADRLAVVRSYGSGNANHTYQEVVSGRNPTKATMGALYARVAGTNHPANGMPRNVLVLPEAIDPKIQIGSNFETNALPTLTSPGSLGPAYAAFNPQGGSDLKQNMELRLPLERFEDRRSLLVSLDRIRRHAETSGALDGMDRYQQQAFDIITGGVAEAFDLSKEDPRVVQRYDTSGLFRQQDVQQWFDMRRASNLLGKQMLLARRLCEAGCGFVTVSDCGWDMHSNNNSPKGLGGMKWLGPQVDHAVAAFLDDVQQRGLSDRILLVITGEMGRTPRINGGGGRDHYGELTPLVFAGGGLRTGQVVGQSDRQAAQPVSRPYRPEHMLATIMHVLFDVGLLRVARGLPRDVLQVITEGEPIQELVG